MTASRFALARRGRQARLVDLAIAHMALAARHRLLTGDRDFVEIAGLLGFELEIF